MTIPKDSSKFASLMKALFKNAKFVIGLVVVVIFIFIGSLSIITPRNGLEMGAFKRDLPPSREHILGVDTLGRDIWTQLVYGALESLKIGLLAGTISTIIGLVTGLISGYKEGVASTILNGASEGFLVLPMVPLLIFVVASVKVVSFEMMCLILGFFGWAWPSRIIRAQILSLKERDFIYVAKASGSRDFSLVFIEILPNVLPFIVISYIGAVIGNMSAEVGLQLIGAAPSRLYTLGFMIYWANTFGAFGRGLWHWILPPVFLMIMLFLGLYSISVALDEFFNPKLRGRR